VLKKTTHTWLKEVGSNVMKQGVKDANEAWQRYFKGVAEKPRLKSKHHSIPKFYVNYETLKKTQNGFQGEKLGIVKTAEPLPDVPEGDPSYVVPQELDEADAPTTGIIPPTGTTNHNVLYAIIGMASLIVLGAGTYGIRRFLKK